MYKIEDYCRYNNPSAKSFLLDPLSNLTQTSTNTTILADLTDCEKYQSHFKSPSPTKENQPNVALISMTLLLGTCAIALALKKLRRSSFFGSYVRKSESLSFYSSIFNLNNFQQQQQK